MNIISFKNAYISEVEGTNPRTALCVWRLQVLSLLRWPLFPPCPECPPGLCPVQPAIDSWPICNHDQEKYLEEECMEVYLTYLISVCVCVYRSWRSSSEPRRVPRYRAFHRTLSCWVHTRPSHIRQAQSPDFVSGSLHFKGKDGEITWFNVYCWDVSYSSSIPSHWSWNVLTPWDGKLSEQRNGRIDKVSRLSILPQSLVKRVSRVRPKPQSCVYGHRALAADVSQTDHGPASATQILPPQHVGKWESRFAKQSAS